MGELGLRAVTTTEHIGTQGLPLARAVGSQEKSWRRSKTRATQPTGVSVSVCHHV